MSRGRYDDILVGRFKGYRFHGSSHAIPFLLTTILMLPVTMGAIRKANRSTWITGFVFGIFLLIIFTLETFGVAHTSAANAGFIISLFAVMVPVIDSILFRKRPKTGLFGAVVLSMLGTALLTLHGYHINIGDFLVLGAAFFRAIQMTFTKRMTDGKQMNSGALTTIQLGVVATGSGIIRACFNIHLLRTSHLLFG